MNLPDDAIMTRAARRLAGRYPACGGADGSRIIPGLRPCECRPAVPSPEGIPADLERMRHDGTPGGAELVRH